MVYGAARVPEPPPDAAARDDVAREDVARAGEVAAALRRWTIDEALPLWSRTGVCERIGGFHERLSLAGAPDADAYRRTRVQARQIYVYAHAHVLGWDPDGLRTAMRGLDFLVDRCLSPDGAPGFVHTVAPDGTVGDPLRDLYDHAFILLALAWLARASGDAQVRALIGRTLAFVDEAMAEGDGTYREGVPASLPRRQNPHMHLFEAMLALHAAIAQPEALGRAAALRALLASRFADPRSGALNEFFDAEWRIATVPHGQVLEPGHHAEWTWLLRTHERLAALPPDPRAGQLLARALRNAEAETGFLPDEVDAEARVLRGSRRCWPQTEVAKAWIVQHEAGEPGAAAASARVLAAIRASYLGGAVPGGWIDRFGADGAPAAADIPASTFYHLFVAFAEADRVFGAASATRGPA